jgi:hypothetical protein
MNIEVDRELAIVLREAINEVLFTGRFDESDEDKLMDLRKVLRDFIAAKESCPCADAPRACADCRNFLNSCR